MLVLISDSVYWVRGLIYLVSNKIFYILKHQVELLKMLFKIEIYKKVTFRRIIQIHVNKLNLRQSTLMKKIS